jgi:DNA-directed RNA polymerase specialized sigma24 family protein
MTMPTYRQPWVEPRSAARMRDQRVHWLRERFAVGRYPLSPALIAGEILSSSEEAAAMSSVATNHLSDAIAALSAEQIRLLQAVFVDHVPMAELAQALRVQVAELWRERRSAIMAIRLALLAQTHGNVDWG